MPTGFFPVKKALQVFGSSPELLSSLGIKESALPTFARSAADNRPLKSWGPREMPDVGQRVGFMKKPARPLAAAIFVTKGGVLKSSLTFNFARMAALHGIRTCVVGLDMQGDVTTALNTMDPDEEDNSLVDTLERLNEVRGLADVFTGSAKILDVIRTTEIPTLTYIPETPELVALDQSLVNRNRREYWLRDHVIAPLKKEVDLVLMDCSPNWNRLITNALVASDVLISPLECKINNFRNMKTFESLINEFQTDMRVKFSHIYVATRLSTGRKLSREIFDWYQENLNSCIRTPIRESVQGEESMAMKLSIPEYAPTSQAADEMRQVLKEMWALTVRAAHNRAGTGARDLINDTSRKKVIGRSLGRSSDVTV
jgi:chromosome partitioning protein